MPIFTDPSSYITVTAGFLPLLPINYPLNTMVVVLLETLIIMIAILLYTQMQA